MSDPVAKARRSKTKDARQEPTPDGPCTRNRRKPKPKKLWEAVRIGGWCNGMVMYSAATREQVEAWIEKQSRTFITPQQYEVRNKT